MTEHHNANKPLADIPKVDFKSVNAKSLQGGFGDIIEILKLNKKKIDEVANRDSEGIGLALVYLIIGALGAPLGGAILGYSAAGYTFRTPIVSALIGALIAVVVAAVAIYVLNLVAAQMFQGKGTFAKLFRVIGYASLINVVGILTIVPFLSLIAGIWLLVVQFIAIREVHKLDNVKTVLTIVVTIVAEMIIMAILGAILGTALLGGVSSFGGITPSIS